MRKLFAIYRHGAPLALVCSLGALLGFLCVAVPALAINEAATALGSGLDSGALLRAILWLFWIWLPLGLGLAFRGASSDALKPEGYPEPGLAGLVQRSKAGRSAG